MDEVFKKVYYDPKTGYLDQRQFYLKLKEMGHDVTIKQVKEWMNNQEINQVMRKNERKGGTTISMFPNNMWQIDIIVYDRYEFNKYKYILNCIDIYSRYLFSRAMTNNRNDTIIENLNDIFKLAKPEIIECDNQFNNKTFKEYFEKKGIQIIYSTAGDYKHNGIVERVNGTLAGRIQKIRLALKRYDWNNYLQDIVEGYNTSIHRTLKDTPQNIFNGKAREFVAPIPKKKLQIGDTVRVKKQIKRLSKGDTPRYELKTYKIIDIKDGKYKLSETKTAKGKELMKIDKIDRSPYEEDKQQREHEATQKARRRAMRRKREGIDIKNIIK